MKRKHLKRIWLVICIVMVLAMVIFTILPALKTGLGS